MTSSDTTALRSSRGPAVLAIAATLIFPGLGHLLSPNRSRARFWMITGSVLFLLNLLPFLIPALVPSLVLVLPISVLLTIVACVDAYRTVRRAPALSGNPVAYYASAIALFILPALFNPWMYIAYFARDHFAEAFRITTSSMSPTLRPGDCITAHKKVPFNRWDLIVFDAPESPGNRFVHRLVGLPNEKLEIRDERIFINDRPIPIPPGLGPYLTHVYPRPGSTFMVPLCRSDGRPGNGCTDNPITLGPDEYFVLGDNSPSAADSRYWSRPVPGHQPGALSRKSILGKATWLYWPPSRWQSLRSPPTTQPTPH